MIEPQRLPLTDEPSGAAPGEPRGAYFHMDAIRTVLALVVAFGHGWALLIRDYQPPANLLVQLCYYVAGFGHQAVILFFVLSGFWISRSVVRGAARGWSWRGYLTDRLTRLMPVLVGALLVGGALDMIAVHGLRSPTHLGVTDTYVLRTNVAANLSWEVLVANLAFLQLVTVPYGTNGPLWSLSYEFWFYIWFPALWLAVRYRRPTVALAALAFGWFVPHLALAFVSWLCGAGVYGITRWLAGRPPLSRRSGWLLAGGMALVLAGALATTRFGANGWKDPALALAFAGFLLSLILLDPPARAALRPLAIFGARASFSFYATHFPVMAFAAALIVGRQRLAPDLYGVTLAFAVTALAMAFAWLFASQTEGRTQALRALIERASWRRAHARAAE